MFPNEVKLKGPKAGFGKWMGRDVSMHPTNTCGFMAVLSQVLSTFARVTGSLQLLRGDEMSAGQHK